MYRELTAEEIPLLIEPGQEFFAESGLPGSFNPEHFVKSWTQIMAVGVGFLIAHLNDDGAISGVIGAMVTQDTLTGETFAVETFWFVRKPFRGTSVGMRLLKLFESKAKALGAKKVLMIHLESINADSLSKIYPRLGYKLIEQTYFKEI